MLSFQVLPAAVYLVDHLLTRQVRPKLLYLTLVSGDLTLLGKQITVGLASILAKFINDVELIQRIRLEEFVGLWFRISILGR